MLSNKLKGKCKAKRQQAETQNKNTITARVMVFFVCPRNV